MKFAPYVIALVVFAAAFGGAASAEAPPPFEELTIVDRCASTVFSCAELVACAGELPATVLCEHMPEAVARRRGLIK